MALVPNSRLIIVGDGPERSNLERAVRIDPRLGPRVLFTGSSSSVATILHASDVLMMTSRTEGMPGVAIEAGLCGVPVISTDVGAIGWMMDHDVFQGTVVPADVPPGGLAVAVEQLRGRTLSTPAAAKGSPCEWTSVVPRWLEVVGHPGAAGCAPNEAPR
jgi:glycosyltransferase involved in cell wall biosynthesis